MPRLWEQTIVEHRHAVRDAALDAVEEVVAARGLSGVVMSTIAERTGIARATLYKYFADADALVAAWHERAITRHLAELRALAEIDDDPMASVERVLGAYAAMRQRRVHGPASAVLHAGDAAAHAEVELAAFLAALLGRAAAEGAVRADVPAGELAAYCLHALSAAAGLPRKGLTRLVTVTVDGLRQPA